MDYQKEIEKHPNIQPEEKMELEKLASMQRDIAIGGSAEDFIRHPFFNTFQNKMNEMINDSKNKFMSVETAEDLKAYKAGIAAITELKNWLKSKVIAGRVGKQAIEVYEQDTEQLNQKIQEAVEKSNQ